MKATYTTIWDDAEVIETYCDYNKETNQVTNVESVDVEGSDLDILVDEFIVLEDGTKIDRNDFLLEDWDF